MVFDPEKHHRHSIRLRDYDYSDAGAYFVTICVQNRECLFGEISGGQMVVNDAGRMVQSVWDDIPSKYPGVKIDQFVVMPNHVHGIIVITDAIQSPAIVGAIHELPLRGRRNMLLPKILGFFKMNTAKRINQLRGTPGIPLWQRNYYEHVIRGDDELRDIREYIANNPVGWLDDENHPDAAPRRDNPS